MPQPMSRIFIAEKLTQVRAVAQKISAHRARPENFRNRAARAS
jgi:hypothetical protein